MTEQDGFSCYQWSQALTLYASIAVLFCGLAIPSLLGKIFWILVPAISINIVLTIIAIKKYGLQEAFSYIQLIPSGRHVRGGGPK